MKLKIKSFLITIAGLGCIFLLIYCMKHPEPSVLKVNILDSLAFRKSFAPVDKLTDKEFQKLEKKYPNPSSKGYGNNLTSQKRLNELGLMRNDTLLVSKFKSLNSFSLKSETGAVLKVFTEYNRNSFSYNIDIQGQSNFAQIKLTNDIQEVKFALVDFVPGGFKEIVALREYHIMNGDNYYIIIYEVSL